jgi:DNA-binding CsgD family transcriptional regulator
MLLLHHHSVHDEVVPLADEVVALAREVGDRRTEGRIAVQWAMHLGFRDPTANLPGIERGLAMCRQEGDHFYVGYAEACLALCHVFKGREDLAEAALDRVAPILREHPSTRLEAEERTRRTFVDFALGRYDEVLHASDRVVELLAGISEVNLQGTPAAVAAWVRVERGEAASVIPGLEVLLQRYLTAGEYQHVPSLLLGLSYALLAEGRAGEAQDRLLLAWELPDLQAFERGRLWFRHDLALADAVQGRLADAADAFGTVLEEALAAANPQAEARARHWLGLLARGAGDAGSAAEHLHRSLDCLAGLGYRQMAASAMESIAGLELDHGRPDAAARLFGAASAVRAEAGVTTRVGWQDRYDADLDSGRRELGPDRWDAELAAGSALGFDDAVALAERGRGERGRPTFGWDGLTATEARVARLIALGSTNAAIAAELLMGRETVKTHVSSILRKLGLENRTQVAAALVARERG